MRANNEEPLVSVVTPVYNGESFLDECIKSVINQSYRNWEYIILNNCSTDDTLRIAEKHAGSDDRIKIFNNTELLPIMQNWNQSLRHMSPESKYCKVVHADDVLFPQCIELMVKVAEQHPSVGIVGAYGLKGDKVVSDKLPFPDDCIDGKLVCRLALLGKTRPFPRPSALLIRSDLIREKDPFYNEAKLQADHEVCYEILSNHDFGFVHQVLTFMRVHDESVSTSDFAVYGKLHYTNLDLLKNFGPRFLPQDEYRQLFNHRMALYRQFLAFHLFHKKNKSFWDYHRDALRVLGYKLDFMHLFFTIVTEFLKKPKMTFLKIKHGMSPSN